ncbi:two-component sensor [Stutzerimonas stutzeri ATCC 14405 = CCUG 16156]|nr:two-component sensor [Stutzerimonas stutzeri ATCC 14405 = CCUG 16156]
MLASTLRFLLLISLMLPLAASAVTLDDDSRAWLEQHPEWRVGVVMGAPYADMTSASGACQAFMCS